MPTLTSLERVLTTLSHKEPDRVPFFLTVTMHGAKELQIPLKEYFSKAEHIVEGQLRMQKKYRHDCLYPFFYAAVETEAWGGEVLYVDDGPPNAAQPLIQSFDMIPSLPIPNVRESPSLIKVLHAIEMLKAQVGQTIPIVGVVMSPFSLPVMQLGFDHYLDLIYEYPDLFDQLMRVNEAFCVAWANAQLESGATAIGYFDPVSSPTIIPRELYLKTGFPIACRTLSRINGPVAMLFASGIELPIVDEVVQTGAAMIGASALEDLADMKAACRGKLAVLGNLNGIEMCRWTPQQTEHIVKDTIARGALGGGFILCDNHGEIPWQVPEEVLLTISETVLRWGTYPLQWVGNG